jgi:hypothetical protein
MNVHTTLVTPDTALAMAAVSVKRTLKKCSLAMDGSTTPHGKLPGMEKDCLTNITAA